MTCQAKQVTITISICTDCMHTLLHYHIIISTALLSFHTFNKYDIIIYKIPNRIQAVNRQLLTKIKAQVQRHLDNPLTTIWRLPQHHPSIANTEKLWHVPQGLWGSKLDGIRVIVELSMNLFNCTVLGLTLKSWRSASSESVIRYIWSITCGYRANTKEQWKWHAQTNLRNFPQKQALQLRDNKNATANLRYRQVSHNTTCNKNVNDVHNTGSTLYVLIEKVK